MHLQQVDLGLLFCAIFLKKELFLAKSRYFSQIAELGGN